MKFPSFSSSHTLYVYLSWSLPVFTLYYTFLCKRLQDSESKVHIWFCSFYLPQVKQVTKQYLFMHMLNYEWSSLSAYLHNNENLN